MADPYGRNLPYQYHANAMPPTSRAPAAFGSAPPPPSSGSTAGAPGVPRGSLHALPPRPAFDPALFNMPGSGVPSPTMGHRHVSAGAQVHASGRQSPGGPGWGLPTPQGQQQQGSRMAAPWNGGYSAQALPRHSPAEAASPKLAPSPRPSSRAGAPVLQTSPQQRQQPFLPQVTTPLASTSSATSYWATKSGGKARPRNTNPPTEKLRTTSRFIRWGEGWKIKWRRFEVIPPPPDPLTPLDARPLASEVMQAQLSQRSTTEKDVPVQRPRKKLKESHDSEEAIDDMFDLSRKPSGKPSFRKRRQESALKATATAEGSTTDTGSVATPLPTPLHPKPLKLPDVIDLDIESDPVERARCALVQLCATFRRSTQAGTDDMDEDDDEEEGEMTDLFGTPRAKRQDHARRGRGPADLFFHIRAGDRSMSLSSNVTDEQGAERKPEARLGRQLWVFAVTDEIEERDEDDEDEEGVEAQTFAKDYLDGLSFEDLEETGQGTFTHQALFPHFYTRAEEGTKPKFIPPQTRAASLSISTSSLVAPTATSHPPDERTAILAYQEFIAGLRDNLLERMVLDSAAQKHTAVLLADSVLHFPRNKAFATAAGLPNSSYFATEAVAGAIRTTLHIAPQRRGMSICPRTTEDQLRPAFTASTFVSVNRTVVLAPLELRARFLRRAGESKSMEDLKNKWRKAVSGTGTPLSDDFVICEILGDGPAVAEVLWPANFVLVEGGPSANSTPESSPVSAAHRALVATATGTSTKAGGALQHASSTLKEMPDRVRLARLTMLNKAGKENAGHTPLSAPAGDTPQGSIPGEPTGYQTQIERRALRIGDMIDSMYKERERAERDATAAKAAASLAAAKPEPGNPPTPTPTVSKSMSSTAPLNMRTPISLGGTSTEAPSPADLVVAGSSMANATRSLAAGLTPTVNLPEDAKISPRFSYPSPPGGDSLQPLGTTLDREALSMVDDQPGGHSSSYGGDFDWNDDFNMGGRGNLNTEYDDGMMMMTLTDNDFDFFDEPSTMSLAASAAVTADNSLNIGSLPTPSASDLLSSLMPSSSSLKFIDHFSHLSSATPFGAAGTPPSPSFMQTSPNLHFSPRLAAFPFDPSNALGFTATPAAASSPYKTPRTPYTPFVDTSGDGSEDGVEWINTDAMHDGKRRGRFEPIPFSRSHLSSDDKYDVLGGKFGLASPAPSGDGRADLGAPLVQLYSSKGKALSWFSIVCDPRLQLACGLKQRGSFTPKGRRLPRGKKLGGQGKDKAASKTTELVKRAWTSSKELDGAVMDESDADSEDEAGSTYGLPSTSINKAVEEVAQMGKVGQTGLALMFARQLLPDLLRSATDGSTVPSTSDLESPVAIVKPDLSKDVIKEAAAAVFVEQVAYNLLMQQSIEDTRASRFPDSLHSVTSSIALQKLDSHISSVAAHRASDTIEACAMPMTLQRHQSTFMKVEPTALQHWQLVGLEPLSGPKNITAFVVVEDEGPGLVETAAEWLRDAGAFYEGLHLGTHVPGAGDEALNGVLTVPAGVLSGTELDKGGFIGLRNRLLEATKGTKNVVLYFLTRDASFTSLRPSAALLTSIQALAKDRVEGPPFVVLPLPLSLATEPRTGAAGWENVQDRSRRIAFMVYDRVLSPISRLHSPPAETFPSAPALIKSVGPATRLFQSPSFALDKSYALKVECKLEWPPSSLEVAERYRVLHVAYSVWTTKGKDDEEIEWVSVVCVDEKGEMWKMASKIVFRGGPVAEGAKAGTEHQRISNRLGFVWGFTRSCADMVNVEWRIVLARVDLMPRKEAQGWSSLLAEQMNRSKVARHTTVLCVDFSPSIALLSPGVDPLELPASLQAPDNATSPFLFSVAAEPGVLPDSEELADGPQLPLVAITTAHLFKVPPSSDFGRISAPLPNSRSVIPWSVHLMALHSTASSSPPLSIERHLRQVVQSFADLAALGEARWGGHGGPWHLETARMSARIGPEVTWD